MLTASVRQRGVVVSVARYGFSSALWQGEPHTPRLIESDGIAVHDLERFHRVSTGVTFHSVLTDTFDMRFRPDGVTDRAARCDIGIT